MISQNERIAMLLPLEGLNIQDNPEPEQVSKAATKLIRELAELQKQTIDTNSLNEDEKAFANELKKLDFDNLQITFATDANDTIILSLS